jgi:HEAT repeat protein
VIVDTDSDVQRLIDHLLEGDENAAGQLVQLGESAITALVARFPGPITIEPQRLESAQPSRCGPLLDVLARIGRTVEPFLLVRTADADAHVRSWATRLLGEIRGPDAARAIAKRFTDEDEAVRRAALSGARMIQKDAESRKALRDALLKAANDDGLPTGTRLTILAALAGVRDPKSVPAIIPLLADPKPEVVKAAEAALTVLTRRQFGADIGRWTEWWDANGDRHRIEWLIDALTHVEQEIRSAAGDELKKITKEYFGYYDDLPRKERAKAQQRYRDWWESRGKAIFA